MSTVIIIAGAALIIYAIYGTVQKFRGKAKSSCCGTSETVSARKVEDTDKSHYPFSYVVNIEGMKCSNCATNVQNALNDMGDVWARVDLGKHRASVLAKNEKTESDFRDALRKTPYRVAGID
ncbi:MAG: heavy-metal-associated domain-containing protein [Clostridia bacterium]|jgi:copper chaperone CopZ|nr:heavy-metal-associated domain-containing protein [Clostridia bacterium]